MGLRQLEYKKIVAIAFVIGLFMDILDTTIINVAVPALQKHFAVGPSGIEWVVTGYLCSLAVWIPASGWIGDRFGTKKTFIFALAMFTAASALCGAAWSLESLIAFRVLQGVGGGMLAPVGTAMLFRAYPPAERARASAVLAIPTVIAPALGPVLGGVLVTHASWRWIFYVNLPMGVAGLIFSVLFLKEHKEPQSGGFDLWGFILSGAGLALVLFALAEGPSKGWTSTTVLATGITGLVAFIALVFVELRVAEPMLDLRLFQDRMFRQANIVTMTMTGSLLGLLFLLPMFLQNRGDGDGSVRRKSLPEDRAASIDDGRFVGQCGDHCVFRHGGSGHQLVVDSPVDVCPRHVHGVRDDSDASRDVRDDHSSKDGASEFARQHQPPGWGRTGCRHPRDDFDHPNVRSRARSGATRKSRDGQRSGHRFSRNHAGERRDRCLWIDRCGVYPRQRCRSHAGRWTFRRVGGHALAQSLQCPVTGQPRDRPVTAP
jgi:MFS family permease